MIVNKMIIKKSALEKLIGEYIVAIYLVDDNNNRTLIKCDFDTKIYTLDKDENYDIFAARHWFRINKGVIQ